MRKSRSWKSGWDEDCYSNSSRCTRQRYVLKKTPVVSYRFTKEIPCLDYISITYAVSMRIETFYLLNGRIHSPSNLRFDLDWSIARDQDQGGI